MDDIQTSLDHPTRYIHLPYMYTTVSNNSPPKTSIALSFLPEPNISIDGLHVAYPKYTLQLG